MLANRRLVALRLTLAAAGVASAALAFTGPADAQGRPRGWLGIAMDDAGSGPGVDIGHVVRGSPADRAGVHEHDRVLKIDGVVVRSPSEVVHIVGGHGLGDTVTVTLLRAGKEAPVAATLGAFPSPDEMLRMDTVGVFAPPFTGLQPLAGFPETLRAQRGRVVLLDFWASWCAPCRILSPVLSGWQARYGAQGLSVIGVTTDTPDLAATAKESLGIRYPVASDTQSETSKAYGVSSLPTLFVIDKRGVVRDVAVGYDPGQDAAVEALVKTLLAEPPPTD